MGGCYRIPVDKYSRYSLHPLPSSTSRRSQDDKPSTTILRVCPQAFFFEHKNTKRNFPARKKVPFLVSMCKVSGWWLAHQKKKQFLPARRDVTYTTHTNNTKSTRTASSTPTHHPLDASFPILILLTMEALPNSPPTMERLIPTGAPTDDMDSMLALPTPHATCLTAEH